MELYQSSVVSPAGIDESVAAEDVVGKPEIEVDKNIDGTRNILDILSKTILPATKTNVRHLVELAIAEASLGDKNSSSKSSSQRITMSTNALVAILKLIPPQDIAALQSGVEQSSPAYQYYAYNTSMLRNPLIDKLLPSGGAITHMAKQLSALKRRGIHVIAQKCKVGYSLTN
jgi:hypothetical protein